MIADDLLKGAIDLHVHGYPAIAFEAYTRVEDLEIAKLCEEVGMKGFVLKSHIWPTVGRAYYLKKAFPGIDIFPSITLNLTAGGLNPVAVESAAKQGAKVVFMPTWSAENDLRRGGASTYLREYLPSIKTLKPEDGISLLDSNGCLSCDARSVINMVKKFKLVLATAHISTKESLVLVEEANKIGLWPIIFSHPDSHTVNASLDEMKFMASKGAYIEFCALGMLPAFQRIHPRDVVKNVREIGVEHCILSTDFFFEWAPPPTEMLRMIVGTLLEMGLTAEEMSYLIKINPTKILRLE